MTENSNLLTFRCPEDLRRFISHRVAETGQAKTAVAIELLRLGAAAIDGVQQPLYDNVQQTSELDDSLLYTVKQDVVRHDSELESLRQRVEALELGKVESQSEGSESSVDISTLVADYLAANGKSGMPDGRDWTHLARFRDWVKSNR